MDPAFLNWISCVFHLGHQIISIEFHDVIVVINLQFLLIAVSRMCPDEISEMHGTNKRVSAKNGCLPKTNNTCCSMWRSGLTKIGAWPWLVRAARDLPE